MSDSPAKGSDEVEVPFERVAGLVRHLTHDVRNGLNSLDLQSAFLQELVTADSEAMPEIKRLRTMIATTAKSLQALSGNFWLPEAQFVTYAVKILIEDVQARLAAVIPEGAADIRWSEEIGDEQISVDLEMIFRAFSEVFKNAIHFREAGRAISVRVFAEGGKLVLELCEGKSVVATPPESWGKHPLVSTRRGGYGMGLFHARRILEVHDGKLDFAFDPAKQTLTTRIALPLAAT